LAGTVLQPMTTESILGLPAIERDPLDLIEALGEGFPVRALPYFKRAARLSDSEFAHLLGLGGRTLTRLKSTRSGRLSADLSDRLYAVASVYALAESVFGERDTAVAWLEEPQFALRGRRPRELLSTEAGRQQVRSLLLRIEHAQLA
jgi:putative toxin-antitoxin system antitoxin component (TIGR02293 family)